MWSAAPQFDRLRLDEVASRTASISFSVLNSLAGFLLKLDMRSGFTANHTQIFFDRPTITIRIRLARARTKNTPKITLRLLRKAGQLSIGDRLRRKPWCAEGLG